jgi:tetratricopeptide (TPR) repeat protein
MSEGLNHKPLSAGAAVVRNPLSVIALFVLLVEAIATVTLLKASGQPDIAIPLVWFVVMFPTLIALLFFGTLWWGHQFLYSPMEYRSDESFLTAMKRLQRLEVRQEAAELNPRTAEEEDSLRVVDRLLDLGDVRAAVKVGRTFLEANQHDIAARMFDHILEKTPENHSARYNVLANLGYAQIGKMQYEQAISTLENCVALIGESRAGIWHNLALAYAHYKLSKDSSDYHHGESQKRLAKGKQDHRFNSLRDFYIGLYPDMKIHLQAK